MFINKIGAYDICFTSNKTQDVPRAQQQTKIQFEKEKSLSKRADSIDANPITAIAYKLYRSYKFMSESDTDSDISTDSTLNVKA